MGILAGCDMFFFFLFTLFINFIYSTVYSSEHCVCVCFNNLIFVYLLILPQTVDKRGKTMSNLKVHILRLKPGEDVSILYSIEGYTFLQPLLGNRIPS